MEANYWTEGEIPLSGGQRSVVEGGGASYPYLYHECILVAKNSV